ncbi:hypothetical protein MIND_00701600 [Mycena indigotica]|uniref:Vacuolar ATPase assembly integral membrane protein VMA21 n=1 Tax=Mycena indigotica TaxID=2126181 RepID=A0A8H6W0U9_9AGAR|nr:uncharacterized protein MIND_00701600 [Mycena indigotica]KAF7301364.1 hypothetical protein MIND_00701600 [Mycena indigotica]
MNQAAPAKLTQDAASGAQLAKLILFSLALGIAPLSSYFGSLKYVWDGNSTYAALTAVVAANIVLVAYIITSILDDQRTTAPSTETKKTQ